MARWPRGEAEVEALIAAGDLQKLIGNAANGERMLQKAAVTLGTAARPSSVTPTRRSSSRWGGHGMPTSTPAPWPDSCGGTSIRATLHDGQIRVRVSDHGTWKSPTRSADRGHGRTVMAARVDRLMLRTGPQGATVEVIKQLAC